MRLTVRSLLLPLLAAAGVALLIPAHADDAASKADPAKADAAKADAAGSKKKVVFIAGGASHGFGAHDHTAGCALLAARINEIPGFEAAVHHGWPVDADAAFANASAVIIYSDGGGGHPALPHVIELDQLSEQGVGIGCIHYAVEVPKDEGGEWWLKWMGGYFETHYSINPHWTATFAKLPEHAVTTGIEPFTTNDEWYYNMRFRENMQGVTPILSAVPPDDTRKGGDSPHGGNEHVRAAIGKNQLEHTLWVSENEGGSRGFGTTGGHFHRNWANDQWRNTVLNAIVWIAQGEVPEGGVQSKRPTVDEMLSNHDEPVPADLNKEAMAKEIEEINKPPQQQTAAAFTLPNVGEWSTLAAATPGVPQAVFVATFEAPAGWAGCKNPRCAMGHGSTR